MIAISTVCHDWSISVADGERPAVAAPRPLGQLIPAVLARYGLADRADQTPAGKADDRRAVAASPAH